MLKKTIITAFLIIAILAGGYWWWHTRGGAEFSFYSTPVKRGDVANTIGATGTIEPLETVDVGAQVAGRISAFGTGKDGKTVDYGSVVEKGTLLAKIDDSVYAADLAVAKAGKLSAEATLEQMRAKLDQAATDWQRSQNLLASKMIPQSDYDTSQANHEVAKANLSIAQSGVAQAEANLEIAQRNLEYCTITSPVSGVIIDRRVNIGQTVVASLNAPSLFLIARDLTKMQIWVSVNEADVGRVKPGAPVTFTVDAFPNRQFQGTVAKVRLNAQMTQNVVLYTVEINIDNPDLLLLPYLTANVRFQLNQTTNTLLVPNAALRWTPTSPAEITPAARNTKLAATLPTATAPTTEPTTRILWLKDGDFARPVEVLTGVTDGVNTAVSLPPGAPPDALREGDEAITGDIAGAPARDNNPFLPKSTSRH